MILDHELVIDNFAGGGGASTGIAQALGREVDIAVNHWRPALAVHAANHPTTIHLAEDVFRVDPVKTCAGRPVGLAWFSPDCTHHSKAKGGKPRSRKLRGLAWIVTRWAKAVRPRIIILENVEEFADWGPLNDDGRPNPARRGETFRAWKRKLASYGYEIDHRVLVAADYGAPTTRKRLFLVARRDGQPIEWPAPTHGVGRARPWRTAAEIIDWSLPCPSIFERKRPLAEATLRRIATGIRRYVIEAAQPFIIPTTHPRDARVHSLEAPLRTVTAAHRGEFALIAPTLVQTGYGEREGQTPRALDIGRPLGTVVAGGAKHALVAALLTKHYGGVVGHEVTRPIGVVTTVDHHSVTLSLLTKFYGTSVGSDVRQPVPTVTAGGQHIGEVRALLERFGGTAQGALFPDDMLVRVGGEVYQIADIGLRMLSPRELFGAQGFPPDYVIVTRAPSGKPITKTHQNVLAGNSVPPPLARAVVEANTRRRAKAAA